MIILKCVTIYLIIGWLCEGISYVLLGGINKFWDEVINEEGFDKRYSQEALDSAIRFSIIAIPFIWPACISYGIWCEVKKSNQE